MEALRLVQNVGMKRHANVHRFIFWAILDCQVVAFAVLEKLGVVQKERGPGFHSTVEMVW